MRIELSTRPNASPWARALAPVGAFFVAFAFAGIFILLKGKSPFAVFGAYVVYPFTDWWVVEQIVSKATPLAIIAIGLSYCFRASLWNIGAEGQYIFGAIFGGWLAIYTYGSDVGPWVWVAMLLLGALGGALYALIPALLKVFFNVNEILTSLMLVYIADNLLDYLVRGPWRDPQGMNQHVSVMFDPAATVPALYSGGRLHLGVVIALVAVLVTAIVFSRTVFGYRLRLTGDAPRAARFAGFDINITTIVVFMISGALAGIAGIVEVSGSINQFQPTISPGYGFTAIIVAFLGRLNPVGILVSALLLALTYVGGEYAQMKYGLPADFTKMFQGMLLICVLAADALVSHRMRIVLKEERA